MIILVPTNCQKKIFADFKKKTSFAIKFLANFLRIFSKFFTELRNFDICNPRLKTSLPFGDPGWLLIGLNFWQRIRFSTTGKEFSGEFSDLKNPEVAIFYVRKKRFVSKFVENFVKILKNFVKIFFGRLFSDLTKKNQIFGRHTAANRSRFDRWFVSNSSIRNFNSCTESFTSTFICDFNDLTSSFKFFNFCSATSAKIQKNICKAVY